ncbi:prepilin peptidase [Microbispora sp. SCL1-1]|uniref:prepilin peptidase n=1 Tax=unclassified Microbispora TaxID=2614687 RepID=UPI00115C0C95|nr:MULTISPECIES: A24 family peptidase [unclassified Microbispora]NJP30164.1 prepilin peptidase [Microbispora sp. CL1-1]TQS02753.1 prepilin peptidase [Microbispora sp. SCL1-1]
MSTIGVALGTATVGLPIGWVIRIIANRFATRKGIPYSTQVITAAVFGLLGWRIGLAPLLPAYLYMAAAGVALSVIDLRTRRLPDALTLPSYVVLLALVAVGGIVSRDGALTVGLILGALGAFSLYWCFRRMNTALGPGDVKASGLVGGILGTIGAHAWVVGIGAGLILAALYAVTMLISRKGSASTLIPYGPFMFAGCLVAVLAT